MCWMASRCHMCERTSHGREKAGEIQEPDLLFIAALSLRSELGSQKNYIHPLQWRHPMTWPSLGPPLEDLASSQRCCAEHSVPSMCALWDTFESSPDHGKELVGGRAGHAVWFLAHLLSSFVGLALGTHSAEEENQAQAGGVTVPTRLRSKSGRATPEDSTPGAPVASFSVLRSSS